MKAKWNDMTWPQRVMFLLQAFLVILFLILYAAISQQNVIRYMDTTFRYRLDGETAVYTGKVDGQKAVFTVSPGPVVEYRLGNTLYGPYTIQKDPTAVPSDAEPDLADVLTGVEIRKDGQVWFRGGYLSADAGGFLLIAEDGTDRTLTIVYGGPDPEPTPRAVLSLALGPEPVPRADWAFFGLGVLLCVFCALTVLFANELFRWNLRFIIRDPENAEPSDQALFSRWIMWIFCTIIALVFFIMGLSGSILS